MKRNSILALMGLLCGGLSPLQALAAGPELDPAFGNQGQVVTSFPGGLDTANGVAVQTDGRIVVAGSSGSDFALTRYNVNGTLDATFGAGGRVHTDFPPGNGGFGAAIVIQADGKIVLAGTASDPATSNSVFALVRYNSNGTLDNTFGGDGRVITAFPGSNATANAIARQSNGKLVVAGVSTDAATFNSVFALARYNTNGGLDTSFGGDGRVTTNFPGVTFEQAHAVAIQANGRIIAAGQGNSSFALARYNANGTPDLSFDLDGMVTTAFGGSFEEARALAIQADGKIIAAGQTALSVAAEDNFALARYNATDGSLDNTFNGNGKVITDFGLVDAAQAVVILPDGRIVAAGGAGTIPAGSFFAVARYNANGMLDNNFSGDGKVLTDFSGGRFGLGALAVALQTNGRIVAAGDANISGQRDFGVARYNTNGSLDASFGAGGKVLTDFPLNEDAVSTLAIQPDGKIIAAGRAQLQIRIGGAQDPNFLLARYNTDGTLDQTFGAGGLVSTDFLIHGDDFAQAAALQPDGRIVVVGQVGANFSQIFTADTAFGIARYNANGSLDTSFGGDGLVTTDFGATHDSAFAVAVQDNGKIVVAGTTGNDFALARYNRNGSLDTSGFGIGGKVTTDFGASFESARAVAIQPDGRIVAAGSSANNFALARYKSDGSLDTSGFGAGGKVTTDFSGGSDGITALVIQPDGKIVAAGAATNPDTGSDFALARYNSDGSLDTLGFGADGKTTTDFGGFDSAGALARQGDGHLVAAGLFFPTDAGAGAAAFFALARYTPNGQLDTAFGAGGKVTTDFFGINSQASALAIQPDGHLVAGGFADTGSSIDFALARYVLPPSQLLNISTRLRVQTGENILIGGFIITGADPKKVLIRGIGPSLNSAGVQGVLADPVLELRNKAGALVTSNDNWKRTQRAEIEASTIPPSNDLESAIVHTLAPGNYTAILLGKNNTTGIGLVEAYDLDRTADSKLANISTRGFIETGDNVMIGGFIIGGGGGASARAFVRAIGPSLAEAGVANALANPTLELRDVNGALLDANDDWRTEQEAEIQATTIPPPTDLEAAIVATLPPGNYTAIVRGGGNTTGVSLVEVYNLQ